MDATDHQELPDTVVLSDQCYLLAARYLLPVILLLPGSCLGRVTV
jgi:hypothetical protein